MTDDRPFTDERLDLTALALDVPAARKDALIAGVIARIHAEQRPSDAVARLLRVRRRAFVVTATLAGLAAAALLALPRTLVPEDPLAGWVESNHVPSNAELLSTFYGYAP